MCGSANLQIRLSVFSNYYVRIRKFTDPYVPHFSTSFKSCCAEGDWQKRPNPQKAGRKKEKEDLFGTCNLREIGIRGQILKKQEGRRKKKICCLIGNNWIH